MVLLHLLLECLHLCGAPVLVVPPPECQLVGWVLEVCWLVPHDGDLDSNSGNLLLNLPNLNSLLQIGLPDFLEAFLPFSALMPFVSALCSEVVLCFSIFGVTGLCDDRCTDCDLVLGLPALEVDAVGLSAIRYFTIYQN